MNSIDNYDFNGKRAIIRVDFNVPLNEKGEVTDDTRIRAAMPTVKKVLEKGGAVILMSHMGRPKKNPDPKYSLEQIVPTIEKNLGVKVAFAGDCMGEKAAEMARMLEAQAKEVNGIRLIAPGVVPERDVNPAMMRNAALILQKNLHNTALVAAYLSDGKPQLLLMYSDDLVAAGRNAGKDIRDAARFIQGGGGGQPGLATAGGKNPDGLEQALAALAEKAVSAA